MRIVFMGTPDFAVPCLQRLCDSRHTVVGVFSQPDKPVGRKQVLTPPPVKALAESRGIPVFQPTTLRDGNAEKTIKELQADVVIVVAYGKILPAAVLTAAKHGCINVHASLLPYYRGAAPIQWAVLNGEKETGVSVMQMDEGLDTGDVLLVKKTAIGENETSEALFERLSAIGADALLETLDLLEQGRLTPQPQPTGDFGYAKMITKDLCPIDWHQPAQAIHNQVRGLQSWPVALTTVHGRRVKIHKTALTDIIGDKPQAGTVTDSRKRLLVQCGDGHCLKILEVQPEGKKRMDIASFLAGNPIETDTVLGE